MIKLTYTVTDKDYDFGTYNYVYIGGDIIAKNTETNGEITVCYMIDYPNINFEKDVELEWDMGYPMDPYAEGGMQASLVNCAKLLEKRNVVIYNPEVGDFEDPQAILTIEEAIKILGCDGAEFKNLLEDIEAEAEAYAEESLQHYVDNLEYESEYEPDYDWYDDYWD